MSLVSVIIPVYNVENYLGKCLNSVIGQTYQNIEIVLVNDGSQDSSDRICDEYTSKDTRITVVHKKNEGVARARLTGFEQSTGELITFVDADDYIDPQYVEKLSNLFTLYDVDMCSCEYNEVHHEKIHHSDRSVRGFLQRNDIEEMLSKRYLLDTNRGSAGLPIFLWGKMIKRHLVREALSQGLGLIWGEDQMASFYLLNCAKAIYALPEPLYFYVQHDGQVTRTYKTRAFWSNQFECWERYKILDSSNLLEQQLPMRIWWTAKQNFKKMIGSGLSYKDFRKEMRFVEKHQIWRDLMRNRSVTIGKRDLVAHLMLEYKLYYPFYKLLTYNYKSDDKL